MAICVNHPGEAASWRCPDCDALLCGACTKVVQTSRTPFETCGQCGALCQAVEAGPSGTVRAVVGTRAPGEKAPAAPPDLDALPAALLYPLLGSGPWILGGGTLFAVVAGYLGALGAVLATGALLGYGMIVLQSTLKGETDAPEWPEVSGFEELLKPMFLTGFVAIVSFGPIGLVLTHYPGEWLLAGVALVLGVLYAPGAWMGAAISERVVAITPFVVIPLMIRLGRWYAAAGAITFAGYGAASFGCGFAESAFPGIVGRFAGAAFWFYALIVTMRALGVIAYHKRFELTLD
jgi:hypothetical protein